MARGIVITAKGQRLNMDELIMKARRPMKPSADLKDQVKPQRIPAPQMHVTGFQPSAAGVQAPPKFEQREVFEIPAAVDHETASMADFTGVTVDEARRLKEKPDDPMAVVSDRLQDIMGDLDKFATRKRTTKKS